MRERGWIEGHNFTVDRRQSPPAGAEAAARGLVQQGAELLMTLATDYAADRGSRCSLPGG